MATPFEGEFDATLYERFNYHNNGYDIPYNPGIGVGCNPDDPDSKLSVCIGSKGYVTLTQRQAQSLIADLQGSIDAIHPLPLNQSWRENERNNC